MSRFLPYLLALALLPGVCGAAPPAVTIHDGPIASALALVDGNRAPEAMKALSSIRPPFSELGAYHYVLGRAFEASGQTLEAAGHYRRASVYSGDPSLQEKALFMAAEAEFRMGYRFEAKTDCLIFLKRFPQSAQEAKVRTLLGRSLSGIGRHQEAVRQFNLAGPSAEALFGKANALQRMGMTIEAARAYSAAMAVDPGFPEFSEETRCFLGENLRMSGLVPRAKELLLKVTGPEYKDYAVFGLGEIAVEESNPEEAIRLFSSLASSKDRKLSRVAMLRASDAEAAAGRSREAAARLDAIVERYPFTAEYDQAVLRLARMRSAAGDPAAALALLSKLVLRPSTVRGTALDEIERTLLAARPKGPAHLASLWNAGGRWRLDSSREPPLALSAADLRGTGKPHRDLVQWLSRYGSAPVRRKYLALRATESAQAGDTAGLRESLKALKSLNAAGDDVTRAEAYLRFSEKDYRGAAKALLA
jgi:tetratricopeptide (TPR) repeat protein